jgi:hypothetical protein
MGSVPYNEGSAVGFKQERNDRTSWQRQAKILKVWHLSIELGTDSWPPSRHVQIIDAYYTSSLINTD